MMLQSCTFLVLASLVFVSCVEEKPAEPKNDQVASATTNKQEKRGIFDLGYGYGSYGSGHEINTGFHYGGHDLGYGLEDHGHVKHVTITKEVPVAVPHPVAVPVEKHVPVPYPVKVAVPVDRPYPVHVPKPYPVAVEKPVPYPVEKPVPYPVKVPVKVPYPVPHPVPVAKPVPYTVHKPVPYPVKVPVYVEKHVPVLVHGHEGYSGLDSEFIGGYGDHSIEYHGFHH